MDHAKLVMSCRFGWSPQPPNESATAQSSRVAPTPSLTTSRTSGPAPRNPRFVPCHGRLLHQLACSHRVRTDIVEDCGVNCLEPFVSNPGTAFFCSVCFVEQAQRVWAEREAQHNAQYPPTKQMTAEQYNQWYTEHQQLETIFQQDKQKYLMELTVNTRPSNMCAKVEATQEETEFANELDSLSLAMAMAPSGGAAVSSSEVRASRMNLPTDPSELLHWQLNSLSLDRGSCAVEYTGNGQMHANPSPVPMDEEDLWNRTRR